MSIHGQTVIQWLESFSPKHLAEEWDKVGLQLGTLQKQVNRVLVTLDVTPDVVEEAIEKKVELIIAHHPIIFRALNHLRTDLPAGKLYEKLIKHDIAVYAAHTNLDIAEGGVNDWLARALGLQQTKIMTTTYQEQLKKLIVFVPVQDEEQLRLALGEAGAGFIGQYSHCTFRTEGIGTFIPQEGTKPYLGAMGQLEEVQEVRLETVYPAHLEGKVLRAMLKAHPYEEVAYDIYALEQKGKSYGLGRVGELAQELTLGQFAEVVKKAFNVPVCRLVGSPDHPIKKVAVLGGSGSKYIHAAQFSGADVFVTGDIDFHTAHDALMSGLSIIDPGHHIEQIMIQGVKAVLEQFAEQSKQTVQILASECHTEPFQFV